MSVYTTRVKPAFYVSVPDAVFDHLSHVLDTHTPKIVEPLSFVIDALENEELREDDILFFLWNLLYEAHNVLNDDVIIYRSG